MLRALALLFLAVAPARGQCSGQVVTLTSSNSLPRIDQVESRLSGTDLTLVVRSALMATTRNWTISLNRQAACQNPVANWVKSFDSVTCEDKWTWSSSLAALASQCAFTDKVPAESGYQHYIGKVYISTDDALPAVFGRVEWRKTQSEYPLDIRVQKQISLSTTVYVFTPLNAVSALTELSIVAGLGAIEVKTLTNWPFVIVGSSLAGTPAGVSATSSSFVNTSCSEASNSICAQKNNYSLAQDGVACRYNGMYSLTFVLACRGTGPCPLPAGASAQVNVSVVDSPDVCADNTVQFNIGLTGSLISYTDGSFATARNTFFTNERAYFRASLSNTVGAVFASVQFDQIRAGNTVLYEPGAPANLATVNVANPAAPSFSFDTTAGLFGITNWGASGPVSVTCDISVTYVGGRKRSLSMQMRRQAIPSGSQPLRLDSQISVQGPDEVVPAVVYDSAAHFSLF